MKPRLIILTLFVLLFLCLVGVLVGAAPARASTTITVSTTSDELNDDGQCSLREALRAANLDTASGATPGECPAGSGADTIILPSGIYTLTIAGANEDAALTGDLDVLDSVTIIGAGVSSTVIDGGWRPFRPALDRVFEITNTATVTISKATIAGGHSANQITAIGGGVFNHGKLTLAESALYYNNAASGAGIANADLGTLTVTNSEIYFNSASSAGGGIANYGSAYIGNTSISANTAATGGGIEHYGIALTITNSAVYENSAGNIGGGINSSRPLTITNSAIYSNMATGSGGGIFANTLLTLMNATVSANLSQRDGGGVYFGAGTADLVSVTIYSNTANYLNRYGGQGGGVYVSTNPLSERVVRMRNTILAGNVIVPGGPAAGPNCYGTLTSQDYNVIQNTIDCIITGTISNNIIGLDPELGPLQNNGGPTLTHALLPGSPAIDAGNPGGCVDQNGVGLTTDQRGFVRPADGDGNGSLICDIGAFEYNSPGTPAPTDTPTNTPSSTRTSTRTPTPTRTRTPTASATSSPTPTLTRTPTASVTRTHTRGPLSTSTLTVTPGPSPTAAATSVASGPYTVYLPILLNAAGP